METGDLTTRSMLIESKASYRADTDQSGEWYVWRRLSSNGWATLTRCTTREDAFQLADNLNRAAKAG